MTRTELYTELDSAELDLANANETIKELKKCLGRLMRSMLAHPDCTKGSEFDDMTSAANEAIKKAS